ncbi:MAG TPA: hypothetical protein VGM07_06135 [Stellaceae bacterium]
MTLDDDRRRDRPAAPHTRQQPEELGQRGAALRPRELSATKPREPFHIRSVDLGRVLTGSIDGRWGIRAMTTLTVTAIIALVNSPGCKQPWV